MFRHAMTVAVVFFAANTAAQNLPKMKPGLWESSTSTAGQKGAPVHASKTTVCINDSVQKDIMSINQGMGAQCSKFSQRRDGNKYIGETECNFGASVMKSRSVTTFVNDTLYRVESRATFTPPMDGIGESNSSQVGKYVGPCPANMKPGDMTMGGRTMNISDMAKMTNKGEKK